MDFSERKRVGIFISVVFFLLLVVVVLVLAFLRNRSSSDTTPPSTNQIGDIPTFTQPVSEQPRTPLPPPPPSEPVQVEASGERYARQVAKIFVERFQSYSSHNDNSHIQDVLPLATERMAAWIETQTINQTNEYQGITTRIISSRVDTYTENQSANVLIGVQQIIEDGNGQRTAYKNGRIELVYSDNTWKVDGLYWDK